MISGKQLHGLRVIDENGGEVGRAEDIVADPDSGVIRGFIVIGRGLIPRRIFVPARLVVSLSLRGMVVRDSASLRRGGKRRGGELRLGELTSGKGRVTDVFLEKERIAGAELSLGLVRDISNGRRVFPWDQL